MLQRKSCMSAIPLHAQRTLPAAPFLPRGSNLGGPQHCSCAGSFIPMRWSSPQRAACRFIEPPHPGRPHHFATSKSGRDNARPGLFDASALARQGGAAEHLFSFPILSRALNSGHPWALGDGSGFPATCGKKGRTYSLPKSWRFSSRCIARFWRPVAGHWWEKASHLFTRRTSARRSRGGLSRPPGAFHRGHGDLVATPCRPSLAR